MDLDGRVVIVTGAGRGIGRSDALLLAELGAKVVVNDLGAGPDGDGRPDAAPADAVVGEIRGTGGEAVANYEDVADWEGAQRLVTTAVDSFGALHALVNNVGVLRNRMLFNATPEEWDPVVRVNLRGVFCPTRWASTYWRDQHKAGVDLRPAVVNTVSHAGIFGSPGGTNYAAGKGGAIAFSVTAARELQAYGVRVNAVGPAARSRLSLMPGSKVGEPVPPGEFDVFDPGNVAPLVAYLASAECPYSGGVFGMMGGRLTVYGGWEIAAERDKGERWTVDEIAETLPQLTAGRPTELLSVNHADPTLAAQLETNERRMEVRYGKRPAGAGR